MGTPHNGIERKALLWQSRDGPGPSHFMINLLQGSDMLNEINDQFAPLMKRFSIFNFWEEMKTIVGDSEHYIVSQESAAPGWDNVEKFVWVLRLQKRYFGMEHPDTLMTRNELGISLCASKRNLIAAQRLVENVLASRKKILGDEHAYTLWSVNGLAKVYIERGRSDEAVSLLGEITPVVERTLGKDHVGMSMTRTNLAKAYFMSERWKDAEETIHPLLEAIPSEHPDWIHAMFGYTHIRFKSGYVEETEKSCIRLMSTITQVKSLSLKDPRTVSIADLLLQAYSMQGRNDGIEAIKRKFPGVGMNSSEDRFDPCAIRKASVLSAKLPRLQLNGPQQVCFNTMTTKSHPGTKVRVVARCDPGQDFWHGFH